MPNMDVREVGSNPCFTRSGRLFDGHKKFSSEILSGSISTTERLSAIVGQLVCLSQCSYLFRLLLYANESLLSTYVKGAGSATAVKYRNIEKYATTSQKATDYAETFSLTPLSTLINTSGGN